MGFDDDSIGDIQTDDDEFGSELHQPWPGMDGSVPNFVQAHYGSDPNFVQAHYGSVPNLLQAHYGSDPNLVQAHFGSDPNLVHAHYGSVLFGYAPPMAIQDCMPLINGAAFQPVSYEYMPVLHDGFASQLVPQGRTPSQLDPQGRALSLVANLPLDQSFSMTQEFLADESIIPTEDLKSLFTGPGYRILDLDCAPGGFMENIMASNPFPHPLKAGFGVALPMEMGGVPVTFSDERLSVQYQDLLAMKTSDVVCPLVDIAFGNAQCLFKINAPERNDGLEGQNLRKQPVSKCLRYWALLAKQMELALGRLKNHGLYIFRFEWPGGAAHPRYGAGKNLILGRKMMNMEKCDAEEYCHEVITHWLFASLMSLFVSVRSFKSAEKDTPLWIVCSNFKGERYAEYRWQERMELITQILCNTREPREVVEAIETQLSMNVSKEFKQKKEVTLRNVWYVSGRTRRMLGAVDGILNGVKLQHCTTERKSLSTVKRRRYRRRNRQPRVRDYSSVATSQIPQRPTELSSAHSGLVASQKIRRSSSNHEDIAGLETAPSESSTIKKFLAADNECASLEETSQTACENEALEIDCPTTDSMRATSPSNIDTEYVLEDCISTTESMHSVGAMGRTCMQLENIDHLLRSVHKHPSVDQIGMPEKHNQLMENASTRSRRKARWKKVHVNALPECGSMKAR